MWLFELMLCVASFVIALPLYYSAVHVCGNVSGCMCV